MSKTEKVKASPDARALKRPSQKTIRRSIHTALKTRDVEDVEEIVESLCLKAVTKRSRDSKDGQV